MEKKSKQYYSLLIGKKAQLPSVAGKLQKDFNFSLNLNSCSHFLIKLL